MFTFEHTHQLSEAEYVEIWSLPSRARPWMYVRRALFVLVATLCLFFPYTMLIGVAAFAPAAIGLIAPWFLPGTAARTFRELRYLRDPVTYGVDDSSVWTRTSDFLAKASWNHVTIWRERQGWLILQGNGFPPVLLPIAGLRAAGVYDEVKEQVERHAKEFGTAGTPRVGR